MTALCGFLLSHWIPEMDIKNEIPILVLLVICTSQVSGVVVPQLDKLAVKILDGEVTVLWKHPLDAPSNSQYNVEMANFTGNWTKVTKCTGITETCCELSSLIHDYMVGYKVRVQLAAGDNVSLWTGKKFLPNTSELRPPTFTLQGTFSSVAVYIHQKPILKKFFSFGVTYTIYLEETGKDTKTTAYLRDDWQEAQRTKVFTSLHLGREYCVSIKVQGNTGLTSSSVSPKQCLLLPAHEWFIIGVSFLSLLGGLVIIAILAAILLCYVKRPVKTPAALKTPVSGWRPLSVGDGTMEVVTDKGWFLSSCTTEVKNCVKYPVSHVTIIEDSEEDRRTSMDSGICIESNSNNKESPPMRQEDSGCGSMGGPESTTSSQTDYPLQDERTDTDTVRKRGDSGVSMGCQLHSSSTNLNGQDSGLVKESAAGGNYRSQSHSAVQIRACDDKDMFKQILPDSALAEVVTGYRAGPQSCICSGAGQCTWCHKQGHHGAGVIKKYRAVCIENGLLGSKCDLVDSYKGEVTFSGCAQKTQTDTVIMDDLETTFLQLGETFPLLTSLSPLSAAKCGRDFNMNNVSLSLCDVQLNTD